MCAIVFNGSGTVASANRVGCNDAVAQCVAE